MAILNNVTITNNQADSDNDSNGDGGGIIRVAGTAQVQNSIIAGNYDTPGNDGGGTINPDCSGAFLSQGFNLIGKSDGCTGFVNGVNGDKVGSGGSPIDPLLSVLANHGGPTQTHALIPGSPAIDAGNPLPPGGGGFDSRGKRSARGHSASGRSLRHWSSGIPSWGYYYTRLPARYLKVTTH